MSNYICDIRCSYRQPSGYCGMTGGYETCQYRLAHQPNTVVGYVPPLKKTTNADRIRAMTDEELAEWFLRIQYDVSDYYCGGHSCEPTLPTGKESWLGWLKQEASDGKD